MELHQILLISFQIMNVLSKKHGIPSSDESIENLLYYKGCQHSKEETTTHRAVEKLRLSKQEPAMNCPYPKMCCTMTCGGNECESSSHTIRQNQMFSMQNNMNQNYPPIGPPNGQSPVQPEALRRKKKDRQPMRVAMQPPIGGRRDFGFTKDRIKNLINQDDDIRKILKDLVKVTMKKVDLVDMINMRKQAKASPPVLRQNMKPDNNNEDDEDFDDDELE